MNMNKMMIATILSLFVVVSNAQQKEGKIIYEYSKTYKEKVKTGTISGNGMVIGSGEEAPAPPPDKYELLFGNNKMTMKKLKEEIKGMVFSGAIEFGASVNDVVFCDFGTGVNTTQKDVFNTLYLVDEPVVKLDWKMSGEKKTILKFTCQKATATIIGKRIQGSMKDGKVVTVEVPDTTTMTAWFTTEIPVPAAPKVQGQLPGVVLELEENTAFAVILYKATALTDKVILADIKPSAEGKKLSPDGFKKEIEAKKKEMETSGGIFRIN
ncbi:GLPGLI family protein [Sphingobacterium lumbrici]|uniref:GLPGLI family protein n=1 Tax=Sphingobacterium lumbrici TaxID=2559600 RepID=UPI00112A4DE9|nr:GLPGLI family protein [Sphingobacterium lumbrici]